MGEGRGEGVSLTASPTRETPTNEGVPSRREELVFALAILAYCLAYAVQVADLPLHSIAYPLILIAALVVLGAAIVLRAMLSAPATSASNRGRNPGALRAGLRGAALAGTAFVFPFAATRLGFVVALALAAFVAIRLISGIGWALGLLVSVIAGLAVTFFLTDVLVLSVPRVPALDLPLGL